MSRQVLVTRQAAADLSAAYDWWAQHRSAEQALRWHQAIVAAISDLAENAERQPLAAENSRFAYEIRQLAFGLSKHPTHRVIFTIRPDAVVVIRVRHLAQDFIQPDGE